MKQYLDKAYQTIINNTQSINKLQFASHITRLLHQLKLATPQYKHTTETINNNASDTNTLNLPAHLPNGTHTTELPQDNHPTNETTATTADNEDTMTDQRPRLPLNSTDDTDPPTLSTNEQANNSGPPKHNRKSLKYRSKHTNQEHKLENCTNPNCLQCATNNIVNLSNIPLTRPQILLLSKVLSFVPTTNCAEPTEMIGDLNIFANKAHRKLKQMIKPRRQNDEPDLYRTTKHDARSTVPQKMGPKALEDAFEATILKSNQPL